MTMASDAAWVRELVAAEAPAPDDRPAAAGWLQRLCRAAARDLPATGVGVSLVAPDGQVVLTAASGAEAALVEELQLSLGEGPCVAALASRSPVHVPDLDAEAVRWPAYVAEAREHGVRSVFAFPLGAGRAWLGTLDVARSQVGPLTAPTTARALAYGDVTLAHLLGQQESSGDAGLLPDAAEAALVVYQAQGMVMVQLDSTLAEALARLRAHAYAGDRTLIEVARDVVSRRLDFSGS